jgi:hypothetical protein
MERRIGAADKVLSEYVAHRVVECAFTTASAAPEYKCAAIQ